MIVCVCDQRWRVRVPPERLKARHRLPRTVRILQETHRLSLLHYKIVGKKKSIHVGGFLQGLSDVQLSSRVMFRGWIIHHTLQRSWRSINPKTFPSHQEHPDSTVEGTGCSLLTTIWLFLLGCFDHFKPFFVNLAISEITLGFVFC